MAATSGRMRLAAFLSVLWVGSWLLYFLSHPVFKFINFGGQSGYRFDWVAFLGWGFSPVGIAWGVWWVLVGFRKSKQDKT